VPQLVYVLKFDGQAGPVEGAEGVMKAITSAPGCTVETGVGPNGLQCELRPVAGATAQFESEVRLTSESSFQESGWIDFGGGDRLRFSTVGEGHLGPSAEEGIMSGAVSWRIEAGEGRLAGASGYITSNFLVTAAGGVIDHHFGLIFVP
jgi:hypothetical protein